MLPTPQGLARDRGPAGTPKDVRHAPLSSKLVLQNRANPYSVKLARSVFSTSLDLA